MAEGKTKEEALQAVRVIADEWVETAGDIKREKPTPPLNSCKNHAQKIKTPVLLGFLYVCEEAPKWPPQRFL